MSADCLGFVQLKRRIYIFLGDVYTCAELRRQQGLDRWLPLTLAFVHSLEGQAKLPRLCVCRFATPLPYPGGFQCGAAFDLCLGSSLYVVNRQYHTVIGVAREVLMSARTSNVYTPCHDVHTSSIDSCWKVEWGSARATADNACLPLRHARIFWVRRQQQRSPSIPTLAIWCLPRRSSRSHTRPKQTSIYWDRRCPPRRNSTKPSPEHPILPTPCSMSVVKLNLAGRSLFAGSHHCLGNRFIYST